jgi:hypothetical protein
MSVLNRERSGTPHEKVLLFLAAHISKFLDELGSFADEVKLELLDLFRRHPQVE